ncbi:hypothetical protein DFR70_103668 [Nocardia tenerifensis]|uniref:Uncharacterized protein n=1 Tax=Nocardia tenerifensis TaxID=228006 RepID=A0A318KID2_9NOCA|nr:GIY-YIG nuclease family protein [Nocardia tenerifensis]PXX66913.1 hypothetical protein DFR70_103668 [Nocardia tenerifensis]
MGYTYISRYEAEDLWKIGKATTLSTRQSSLRTGAKEKLRLYDYVETEHALEGERFLKRRWVARKHRYRKEVYRLTEAEVRAGLGELERWLVDELPTLLAETAQVAELDTVDNTETMVDPTDEITAAHRRLVQIEAEQRALADEAEPLRRAILLAIGKDRGITGVATYDKADSNRWFDAEKFEAEHPDIARQFLKTSVDGMAVRKQYPDLHEAFMQPPKKRTFILIEDLGA